MGAGSERRCKISLQWKNGVAPSGKDDDDDFLIPFALHVLGLWDYNLVSIRRFGA
jgi:hypothetical protein